MSLEHDALKRFIKATEEFESRFGSAILGRASSVSETGEPYIEHVNGERRNDGNSESFTTADEATEATFRRLAKLYPSNPSATLYWRVRPEIDYSQHRKGYLTYCRFLLSNQPTVNHG